MADVETSPAGRRDGAGMNTVGGMSSGAVGRLIREPRPQGRRDLRSSRVVRADEQRWLRLHRLAESQICERLAPETDIATSAIATGAATGDHPYFLEHVEMVGEQIRSDPNELLQLYRGAVRGDELVDDHEPGRVAERRIAGGSSVDRVFAHRGQYDESAYIESTNVE
jgi:hypothetical protein